MARCGSTDERSEGAWNEREAERWMQQRQRQTARAPVKQPQPPQSLLCGGNGVRQWEQQLRDLRMRHRIDLSSLIYLSFSVKNFCTRPLTCLAAARSIGSRCVAFANACPHPG